MRHKNKKVSPDATKTIKKLGKYIFTIVKFCDYLSPTPSKGILSLHLNICFDYEIAIGIFHNIIWYIMHCI